MHRTDNNSIRCTRRPIRAFTMIEVLIVIAITVILFGLLIRPLVDTLRYTKDAQLQAAAQDSARKTLEMVSREIGSAAYISDNATHAFNVTVQANLDSSVNGALREQYSNFLNVQVPSVDPSTGQPTTTGALAHIYNAKLDIVMARHTAATGVNSKNMYDPTAGNEPIMFDSTTQNLVGESGSRITSTPLMFPLAPGTTMIRYFIGLKNPDQPYSNQRDQIKGSPPDNSYVLYRAQFSPDGVNPNQPTVNLPMYPTGGAAQSTNNYLLFDTDRTISSSTFNQPILDDPDFFRPVTTSDTNWLSYDHSKYTTDEAYWHNQRYELWKQIAKPVISAPEIDLLIMPHNQNRMLSYDTSTGPFPGVAHYGVDHDPVTGTDYPMEHTSVQFLPGAISTDAAPSTTSDYQEKGIAGGTTGVVTGLPYIPTQYQAVGQAWTRPYYVYLYPTKTASNGATTIDTTDYFYITQAMTSVAGGSGGANLVNGGDLVEYHSTASNAGGTPVYNLSTRQIVATDQDIVPASINEDLGTINFSVPAVPGAGGMSANPPNAFAREWVYTPPSPAVSGTLPTYNTTAFASDNVLDLTQNDDAGDVSPLNNDNTSAIGKYLDFAFIVPGSLRIYGPDMNAGPGTAATAAATNTAFAPPRVLYTEVSANETPGANQYQVDYFTGKVTFGVTGLSGTGAVDQYGHLYYWPANSTISAIYDYQCNMRPITRTSAIAGSSATSPNQAYPLAVKVTYHSRAYLNLSVGVRYIDSYGNAQDVVLSNSVKVGNINR